MVSRRSPMHDPGRLQRLLRRERRARRDAQNEIRRLEGERPRAHSFRTALDGDRNELLEMIARHASLGQVLSRLQAMVESYFPGSGCLVLQAPAEGNRQPLLEEEPEPSRGGQASWGLQQVPDLAGPEEPPVLRTWAEAGGLREGWSLPILFGGAPFLGTLVLGYPEAPAIGEHEVEILEVFARMAGMAINHRRLLDTLSHQARFDTLTNLPNRALFQDRLQQAFQQSRRNRSLLGLLFLDLDGFKHINDTLGHHVGDQLLVEVSRRLQSLLRATDTLARMGGDEFTVVLPNLKEAPNASKVAMKCLRALGDPFLLQGHELFISASIGISLYPQDALEPDQLQRNADAAMYQAKAKGKNGYSYFTPDLNQRAQERMELEGLLRRAMENGEFLLHFQPQFRVDGTLLGCEALLRWDQPRLGMISPARFIPLAEENGLILPLGEWVLREACRHVAGWHRRGHRDLVIAVNVSSLQFEREDFVHTVAEVLAAEDLDPRYLELELTESLVMQNPRQAALRLGALRNLGVRIAVDDFGTGYSSLSYLQRLPLDTLKIDQSFVRDIYPKDPSTPSSAPIVETIVALARSLKLSLMAEGVETEAQKLFLENLRCEGIQGYLFAKPMAAQTFGVFLTEQAASGLA